MRYAEPSESGSGLKEEMESLGEAAGRVKASESRMELWEEDPLGVCSVARGELREDMESG